MIETGIVGASGYSGEVLVRLLAKHPRVRLTTLAARSLAGRSLAEAMPSMADIPGDLSFIGADPAALAASSVEVFFLALPHGVASEFALPLVEAGKVVIDLSADFRLHDAALYREAYGADHPAPERLASTPYVIPELAAPGWEAASLIACPGCYPTSVQLPLVPLLRTGCIESRDLVINSVSGVSGAGRKATEFYSYCEREGSVTAYGIPRHRHAVEIEEQLGHAAKEAVTVQFVPHLVPMVRGIQTTIIARAAVSAAEAREVLRQHYTDTPFVRLLPAGKFPDTRAVAHTNRCDLSLTHDPRTGHFILNSAIDNLLKGASGQAIQILNGKFGWPATDGLL